MEILDFQDIPALGISKEACEKYDVPMVKTRQGVKLGACYGPYCTKILNLTGGHWWEGDYDPQYGLFGQKAITPDEPCIVVLNEIEVLKLASLGYPAICLASLKAIDEVSLTILADNFSLVTTELWVWKGGGVAKTGSKELEKFLLFLAKLGGFEIKELRYTSDKSLVNTPNDDIQFILDDPTLQPWKPKGIAFSQEIMDDMGGKVNAVDGVSCGIYCIDEAMGGFRPAEVTTIAAGTGIGKSTTMEEIEYHIGVHENKICGLLHLENPKERSLIKLASIMFDVPLKDLRKDPTLLTKKQWEEFHSHPKIHRNFVFFSHFGSIDREEMFSKIDYMIDFCKCEFIFLDHISIAVSGMSSKEGERKDIDILMTELAQKAVAKNVHFVLISHLSQPDGSPHEEGGRVTLRHLRGSGGIKQLSWNIFVFERNQQDENSTRMLVRFLKCRETGLTGPVGVLNYNLKSGRIEEDTNWSPTEFEATLRGKSSGKGTTSRKTKIQFKEDLY